MSGEEAGDMATMWWVYWPMAPYKLAPLFLPIDFEVDAPSPASAAQNPSIDGSDW